tara:strand:+ start:2003 stop:2764 length:762 start_codon:yes stop_codon:yes gene_type:complete
MKLKTTLILLTINFCANAQSINNFELEPFYNPFLLNVSKIDKQINTIDERHSAVTFVNRPTNQFGFNINYKFKKNFIAGIGMSWWERNYDFTLSVTEESKFNYYLRNQEREIKINYRSFHFFVGYDFKFNSRIKLEYTLSNSKKLKHNVPQGLEGQYFASSGGFNYKEKERISPVLLLTTIGINYSIAIYKNLRIQLGVNFTLKKLSPIIYKVQIEGQTNQTTPKSTFLDMNIGSSSEQFFYTGFIYQIKYKK